MKRENPDNQVFPAFQDPKVSMDFRDPQVSTDPKEIKADLVLDNLEFPDFRELKVMRDYQVHPDVQAKLVVWDCPESEERRVMPVKQVSPALPDSQAKRDKSEPQGNLVGMVRLDHQEMSDQLDFRDSRATKAFLVCLAPLVLRVTQDFRVLQDPKDPWESQASEASKEKPDGPDCLASVEKKVARVLMVFLDKRAMAVYLAHPDFLEPREKPDFPDNLEKMEFPALRVFKFQLVQATLSYFAFISRSQGGSWLSWLTWH